MVLFRRLDAADKLFQVVAVDDENDGMWYRIWRCENFVEGKGTVRINFSDVFASTNRWGSSTFAGQYVYARAYWEPRQLRISFNYRFGSTKIKQSRQRKTGIKEESRPTNSSNN
jgi:hypothetical protein